MERMRQHRGEHALGNDSARGWAARSGRLPQEGELFTKLIEHGDESLCCSPICCFHFRNSAKRLENDVDRAIVEVEASTVG